MTDLKYYDGDRFEDTVQFRDLPHPVGTPKFWWPLNNGYDSDSVGFGQGTNHGAEWVRGSWAGGWALKGDGESDYVSTSDWGNFGSTLLSSMSIAFTVSTDTATQSRIMGVDNDFYIWIHRVSNRVSLAISGENNDWLIVNNGEENIADGRKYRIVFSKSDGNTASDVDIWINGNKEPVETDLNQGPTNPSNFNSSLALFAMDNNGLSSHFEGILDNIMVYSRDLTEEEIKEDYRRQPWSEVN